MDMIIKASAAVAGVRGINKPGETLDQNAPNPFTGATNIPFYLPNAGYAKLAVYNTIGQLVATLADGNTDAGWHSITFSANDLAAGVYYYRLSTDAGVESRAMMIK
jgi:hypothetical protein